MMMLITDVDKFKSGGGETYIYHHYQQIRRFIFDRHTKMNVIVGDERARAICLFAWKQFSVLESVNNEAFER